MWENYKHFGINQLLKSLEGSEVGESGRARSSMGFIP